MEKFKFEPSTSFDELVEEVGLDGISDFDISEECKEENVKYSKLETWDYEDGFLVIYAEPAEEYLDIVELIEKRRLTEEEINIIEESPLIETCSFMGIEYTTNTTDYLYHVKFCGQEEIYSVVTNK